MWSSETAEAVFPFSSSVGCLWNRRFLAENHGSFVNCFNINWEFGGFNYFIKGNTTATLCSEEGQTEILNSQLVHRSAHNLLPSVPTYFFCLEKKCFPLLNTDMYLLLGLNKNSVLKLWPELRRQTLRQKFHGLLVQRLPPQKKNPRQWKKQ